jgi:hypothetical protein
MAVLQCVRCRECFDGGRERRSRDKERQEHEDGKKKQNGMLVGRYR